MVNKVVANFIEGDHGSGRPTERTSNGGILRGMGPAGIDRWIGRLHTTDV